MGVGPSTKETSLHHFRDPLIRVLGEDPGIDLMGVLVYGSMEGNEEKIRNSRTAAVIAECARPDGVIVETDGWGNLDVDYVNCVNEVGERGIPVAGLNWSGTAGTFVVESPYLDNVVDFNKNPEGIESNIVGENNYTEDDVRECLKRLKIAMLKKECGMK